MQNYFSCEILEVVLACTANLKSFPSISIELRSWLWPDHSRISTFLYFIVDSICMVSWPGHATAKHPQTMALPPPCFADHLRIFSWNSCIWFTPNMSSVMVSKYLNFRLICPMNIPEVMFLDHVHSSKQSSRNVFFRERQLVWSLFLVVESYIFLLTVVSGCCRFSKFCFCVFCLMEKLITFPSQVYQFCFNCIIIIWYNLHFIHSSFGEMVIPAECVLKIFKTTLNEFKNRDKYIKNDYRFKDRFSKLNPRKVIRLWAEKEMHNLTR